MRHKSGKTLLCVVVLALCAGITAALLSGANPVARDPAGQPVASAAWVPVRPPLLTALGADAPLPTAAGLQVALAASLRDGRLGGAPAFSVLDVLTGQVLLSGRLGVAVVPASTAKIATAIAVLLATTPGQRLRTAVLAGPNPGDVVLVGGGDPTLAGPAAGPVAFGPARLVDLAAQVRAALGTVPARRVLVDDRLFTGAPTGDGWKPGYVSSGNVAPVMALSVDGGRLRPDQQGRVADPALAAGRALAGLLGGTGAELPVGRGAAAPGAATLGAVLSPPVPVLVEQML